MEHLQSIQNLFKGNLFTIPDYQRGYAWEEPQWQDLWDDLELLNHGQEHYTGTLVIQPVSGETVSDDLGVDYTRYDVVDGQQRLTTLSILLNEIILQFESIDKTPLAESLKKTYVCATKNNMPLPKLQLNRDANDFYNKMIIGSVGDVSAAPKNISQKRLLEAKAFFRQCLDKQCEKSGESFAEWLGGLRTKIVSQMKLTVYEVHNTSDVGVIFEVMNNRGKTLTEMEKTKNYLLYVCTKLPEGGKELAEEVNKTWKYLYETVMEYDVFNREDNLLRFNWIVTQQYQAREWNGSNSIKAKFGLKAYPGRYPELRDDIRKYVDLLRQSCKAFCDINNPEKDQAFDNFEKIEDNLRKEIVAYSRKLLRLNTLAVFTPLLIAFRLKMCTPEDYLELLKICEKFAFRVFKIGGWRAHTGQSRFYAWAFCFYAGEMDPKRVHDCINSWLTYYCNQEVFEEKVDAMKDWYHWNGLNYLLFEYELDLASGAPVHLDWKTFNAKDKKDTIEHILPQTPDKPYWRRLWPKKRERESALHDLGNLVVTLDNSSYGNKGFDEKKGEPGQGVCYANSSLFSERELCNYEEWDFKTFTDRREKLTSWIKEHWYIEDYQDEEADEITDETTDDEEMNL